MLPVRRLCVKPERAALPLLGALCLAGSARAAGPREPSAPPPRAERALGVGLGIELGSLAAGSMLLTSDGLGRKRAGLAVAGAGFTLAPLASHALSGEWGRGLAFALPPALAGLGMAVLLAARPDAPIRGKNHSQLYYPALITLSVAGGTLGVCDAALVDERAAARVRLGAAVSPEFVGALLGGRF